MSTAAISIDCISSYYFARLAVRDLEASFAAGRVPHGKYWLKKAERMAPPFFRLILV